MARIPFVAEDIKEPAALVNTLRARHGGKLIDIERMMLHSPTLATAWNGFFSTIKSDMVFAPKLREMIVCAVGVLNGAEYQYVRHGVMYQAQGGTQAQLDLLRDPDTAVNDRTHFDRSERAVLQLLIEMTRNISVTDATFAEALDALGGERAMVEVVGVIAGFNLVSRFTVALGVDANPDDPL